MEDRKENTLQTIQAIIDDLKAKGERVTYKRIGELYNGGVSKQRIDQIFKLHGITTKFKYDNKQYVEKIKSLNIDTSKYTLKELKELINYKNDRDSGSFCSLLREQKIPFVRNYQYNFEGIDTAKFTLKELMYEINYEKSENAFRSMISDRGRNGKPIPYMSYSEKMRQRKIK